MRIIYVSIHTHIYVSCRSVRLLVHCLRKEHCSLLFVPVLVYSTYGYARPPQFKSARPEELQDRKLKCTLVPEPAGARGFGQTASRTSNLPADASNAPSSDEETRRKVEQLAQENLRLRRQLASDSAKQAPAASAHSAQSGLSSSTQDAAAASTGGGVVFWLSMALFAALVFVLGAALGTLYLAPMLD